MPPPSRAAAVARATHARAHRAARAGSQARRCEWKRQVMDMNSFEVIDAFLDQERVDPEQLKAALATEDGRAYLVDFVAMREIASEHPQLPALAGPAMPR